MQAWSGGFLGMVWALLLSYLSFLYLYWEFALPLALSPNSTHSLHSLFNFGVSVSVFSDDFCMQSDSVMIFSFFSQAACLQCFVHGLSSQHGMK